MRSIEISLLVLKKKQIRLPWLRNGDMALYRHFRFYLFIVRYLVISQGEFLKKKSLQERINIVIY